MTDPQPVTTTTASVRAFLTDAAERVLATFVEAFLGAWALSPALDISTLQIAGIAGLTAAAAVVKATAAAVRTGTLSPASLASSPAGTARPPIE